MHIIHIITGTIIGFSSSSLFILARDVFRENHQGPSGTECPVPTNVYKSGKREEDLKALILKEKKKKKKVVGILNMGRSFGERLTR